MALNQFSMFIMKDGTVKSCGNNNGGCLGLGHSTQTETPTTITGVDLSNVKEVVLGSGSAFFLMNDGTVMSCGGSGNGQLGHGDTTSKETPTTISGLTNVKQVSITSAHTLFLMEDGTVKGCGGNDYGQLGLGNTTHPMTTLTTLPISGVKYVGAISSGSYFVMNNGTVKVCGRNYYGDLALGNTTQQTTIQDSPYLTGVKKVFAGYHCGFFLMEDGTVYSVGYNGVGQLGLGDTTNKSAPYVIPNLTGVKHIACGNTHTLFLMEDGTVKGCGGNGYGQLAKGDTTGYYSTIVDATLINTLGKVKHVSAGYDHSAFLLTDGTVQTCGSNLFGELGDGTTTNVTTSLVNPVSDVKRLWVESFATLLHLIKSGTNVYTLNGAWNDTGITTPTQTDFENLDGVLSEIANNNPKFDMDYVGVSEDGKEYKTTIDKRIWQQINSLGMG